MKKISIRDLDFNKLTYKDYYNEESDIYIGNNKLYKLFKSFDYEELENKEKKIEILNNKNLDKSIIIPDIIITQNDCFRGCGMDYIDNTRQLFSYKKHYNDLNNFMKIVNFVSNVLENSIHKNNIVVCDLSFSNIIIDEELNPYFIDFDSCSVDNIKTQVIASLLSYYYKYRKVTIDINQNMDRLSLILNTLYIIFRKKIENISLYEYDELKEQIYFLEELKELFLELKKQERFIPDVPYISEFIKKEEKYKFKS